MKENLNKILKNRIFYYIVGLILVLGLTLGILFGVYRVKDVEIVGASEKDGKIIKTAILKGPSCYSTILAPMFHKNIKIKDMPLIDNVKVQRIGNNTLVISLVNKKIVGCISYLGNYVYFNKDGYFISSLPTLQKDVPYYSSIKVNDAVEGKELNIPKKDLQVIVSLDAILKKRNSSPDEISLEGDGVELKYGDIIVDLGDSSILDDKINRVEAILPKLKGKKGILHLESVNETSKQITFEMDKETLEKEKSKQKNNENNKNTSEDKENVIIEGSSVNNENSDENDENTTSEDNNENNDEGTDN